MAYASILRQRKITTESPPTSLIDTNTHLRLLHCLSVSPTSAWKHWPTAHRSDAWRAGRKSRQRIRHNGALAGRAPHAGLLPRQRLDVADTTSLPATPSLISRTAVCCDACLSSARACLRQFNHNALLDGIDISRADLSWRRDFQPVARLPNVADDAAAGGFHARPFCHTILGLCGCLNIEMAGPQQHCHSPHRQPCRA